MNTDAATSVPGSGAFVFRSWAGCDRRFCDSRRDDSSQFLPSACRRRPVPVDLSPV